MNKSIERRAFPGLELREAPQDSGYIGILSGYAARFNTDSYELRTRDGSRFIERIAPGAFTRTLGESPDIYALVQHREDLVAGRAPDTLTVREDEHGLLIEIRLIDTPDNRSLLGRVRAKQVDSMSFGFAPAENGVAWDLEQEPRVRTLTDVDLAEVSVAIFPAYPGTSVSARSGFFRSRGEAHELELRAITEELEQFQKRARASDTQSHEAERQTWHSRLRIA